MSTEERLHDYNTIYNFKDDPDRYSFEKNPERIIIRNSAIRERNSDLYLRYLTRAYPASIEREMEQFGKSLSDTALLSITDAQVFFDSHGVILVQSDIAHVEDDAIFVAKIVSQSEADALVQQSASDPLLQYLKTERLSNKQKLWIDASEIRNIYHATSKI